MDYADNYTARYVLNYYSGGTTHSQTWRYGAAADFGAIEASIDAITGLWTHVAKDIAVDLAFLDAVFYAKDSDVSIPAALPAGINDLITGGALQMSAGAKFVSKPWSTIAGGKQVLYFYGYLFEPSAVGGQNYRFEQGESVNLDAATTAFNAMASSITGNDGQQGRIGKSYWNYGINPAIARRKRR